MSCCLTVTEGKDKDPLELVIHLLKGSKLRHQVPPTTGVTGPSEAKWMLSLHLWEFSGELEEWIKLKGFSMPSLRCSNRLVRFCFHKVQVSRKNWWKEKSRIQTSGFRHGLCSWTDQILSSSHNSFTSSEGEAGKTGLPKPSPPRFIRHHHHRHHHLQPRAILLAGEAHVIAINYRWAQEFAQREYRSDTVV